MKMRNNILKLMVVAAIIGTSMSAMSGMFCPYYDKDNGACGTWSIYTGEIGDCFDGSCTKSHVCGKSASGTGTWLYCTTKNIDCKATITETLGPDCVIIVDVFTVECGGTATAIDTTVGCM
jgi:hypothetical protein